MCYCVESGGVYVMGFCVASGDNFLWFIVWRVVVSSCRCFGISRSLQKSGCSEISIRIYHYTLPNDSKERSSYTGCPRRYVPDSGMCSLC